MELIHERCESKIHKFFSRRLFDVEETNLEELYREAKTEIDESDIVIPVRCETCAKVFTQSDLYKYRTVQNYRELLKIQGVSDDELPFPIESFGTWNTQLVEGKIIGYKFTPRFERICCRRSFMCLIVFPLSITSRQKSTHESSENIFKGLSGIQKSLKLLDTIVYTERYTDVKSEKIGEKGIPLRNGVFQRLLTPVANRVKLVFDIENKETSIIEDKFIVRIGDVVVSDENIVRRGIVKDNENFTIEIQINSPVDYMHIEFTGFVYLMKLYVDTPEALTYIWKRDQPRVFGPSREFARKPILDRKVREDMGEEEEIIFDTGEMEVDNGEVFDITKIVEEEQKEEYSRRGRVVKDDRRNRNSKIRDKLAERLKSKT